MRYILLSLPGRATLSQSAIFFLILCLFACKNTKKPPEKDVVKEPEQLEVRTKENLQKIFTYVDENKGKLNDSISFSEWPLLKSVYAENAYQTVWSYEDDWKPLADSLFGLVKNAKEYGLFPSDYNYAALQAMRDKMRQDVVSRRDAALWARADMMFTDAFFKLAKHLKLGRLERDSITLRKDSLYDAAYFLETFKSAIAGNKIIETLQSLEPHFQGYTAIRAAIPAFLQTANFKKFTYLVYPYKDSIAFVRSVERRLIEEGLLDTIPPLNDTVGLRSAIRRYQEDHEFKVSGKISEPLIRSLNNTDEQKFKSIAVTLDQFKLMPDTVPVTYMFVNLPSYTLFVYNDDTLALKSKVIVGAPGTRTPQLNSKVSNFITYPQWTVPYSIVFRDMLPRIQKNIGYLSRQNLMVVDRYDSVVDPASINWSKMDKKHFPYLIRQKEGDDNSLGIIKFNFANKYSVYLHDTNARSLFSRSNRALSHGCVRVKEWEKLSQFLISPDTMRFKPDSLSAWMIRQEKHTVTGFPRVPLYIRYNTVEGVEGSLKFYSDIYGYDRLAREKYFAKKEVM